MKKVTSMILALAVLLSALFCFNISSVFGATSGTCGNNTTWAYDEATTTLTISGTGSTSNFGTITSGISANAAPWYSYKPNITKVVVEEGVTKLGELCLYNCTALTTVSLPSSLIEIAGSGSTANLSKGAFRECPLLTTINFPSKLTTIGNFAFYNCTSLSSVLLPSTLTTIGDHAFNGCTALTRISFPDSLTSLGKNAFYGCTGLETVTFGTGLTAVPDYCFYNAGVKNINFSSTITAVNQYAFYNCKMTKVNLPETIESVGLRAFSSCSFLAEVVVNNPNCTFNQTIKDPFNGSAVSTVTFYGHSGSTTQTFVEAHAADGYVFVPLGDCDHSDTREEITIAPTCTEKGLKTVICNTCGFEVSKTELPANGHTWEVTEQTDSTETDGHIYTSSQCSACGETKDEIEHVDYVEGYYEYTNTATCTRPGIETYICTVEGCGASKRLPSLPGNHQVAEYTVTLAPTCTEKGSQEGVCTICGETVVEEIPATGHTNEHVGSLDSTAEDGHTYELYKCSVCDVETAEPTHVEWVEGYYTSTVILEPKCVIPGTQSNTCTICNKIEVVQLPANGAHVWVETGRTEPTCTATGKIDYKCENCTLTKYDNIDALGHDYVLQEGDSTYPATCTTDGNNYYKCSRCASSKSEKIAALGHTVDETNYTIKTEPECETEGLASSVCTVCGVLFDITLEALGHNYENVVVAISGEPGHSMSTPTCTRCGRTDTAVKVHEEWIDGYYTTNETVVGSNSCTAVTTIVDTCTFCNTIRTNTVQGPGHKYHYTEINESGSFVYTCDVCSTAITRTPASLLLLWNTSYINTTPDETQYGYLFEVTGNNFINARDYGELVRANKTSQTVTTEPSTEETTQN